MAGLAVGAVLVTRPESETYDGATYTGLERKNYRVPGIAAMGVGGAMLVGGTIMLAALKK